MDDATQTTLETIRSLGVAKPTDLIEATGLPKETALAAAEALRAHGLLTVSTVIEDRPMLYGLFRSQTSTMYYLSLPMATALHHIEASKATARDAALHSAATWTGSLECGHVSPRTLFELLVANFEIGEAWEDKATTVASSTDDPITTPRPGPRGYLTAITICLLDREQGASVQEICDYIKEAMGKAPRKKSIADLCSTAPKRAGLEVERYNYPQRGGTVYRIA